MQLLWWHKGPGYLCRQRQYDQQNDCSGFVHSKLLRFERKAYCSQSIVVNENTLVGSKRADS